MREKDFTEFLNYIDPSSCNYTEWTNIGMALKYEGCGVDVWDSWSAKDPSRYHSGECARKWNTFSGNESPVTGGTIYQMAYDRGWRPDPGHELDWEDAITRDDELIIDSSWTSEVETSEPGEKFPSASQAIRYLETLFESGEFVGYVMQSQKHESDTRGEKWVPRGRGNYQRTAEELIADLKKHHDIGEALGDYSEKGGAWIRFNPLDGEGVGNKNVAAYRYALVESDDMEVDRQNAMIRELNLPVACMVHSGGKSIHAIVRVDAQDSDEYKKRVKYLYDVCRKNGMTIDEQNKNPSRLSRLPGVTRNGRKQYIIDTNIGAAGWDEWVEWYENETDDLPETESLESVWDDMPALAPELIKGILRHGHKMLIAGPSKAGKSFLLIELCIAVAEGRKWLGRDCAKGKVLYVNLELDRASCLNRFRASYTASRIAPENVKNIDIWNLRGKAIPMDKLAPRLIRRAKKKGYKMVVVDPIYKVITGDENSAEQMSKFCNQFDRICTDIGCATVYCHHHSKGAQGQKASADRASGSGVFARDPDAMLDMIELPLTEDVIKQQRNKAQCAAARKYLDGDDGISNYSWSTWKEELSQDDLVNARSIMTMAENKMSQPDFFAMKERVNTAAEEAAKKTAYRIEATLREFERPDPINIWFDYPTHYEDPEGVLGDLKPETDSPGRLSPEELKERRKEKAKARQAAEENDFEVAFEGLAEEDGRVLMSELAEELDISANTLGLWLGKGKKSKANLKKRYEKIAPDGPGTLQYVQRKEEK